MATYYRPSRRRTPGIRPLAAATLLVIALVAADAGSGGAVRRIVRESGASASGFASRMLRGVSESGVFASRRSLEERAASLEAEASRLRPLAAAAPVLQAENDQLRALVRLAEPGGVTAPVVSSVLSSPYGTFVIGAGAQEGIVPGAVVVGADGYAIGVVSDVSPHRATVREALAPDAKTEAVIGGIAAVLTGSGGGNGRAPLPRDAAVSPGELAFAPALGQRPVGIVGAIASSSASATQEAYVRLPVNLSSLRYVYVIPLF